MPAKNRNNYTQKEFEQDLKQLEKLIEKKGGENKNNNNKENNNDKENNNKEGGAKPYSGTFRTFKLVEVNGKPIKIDARAYVKEHQTPLNGAKKLLKSWCRHEGIKKNDRTKVNITFTIQETTQGSSKKQFGPYTGKYMKYTPEQMKQAKAAGIVFSMKPIVKLRKQKMENMKGGN